MFTDINDIINGRKACGINIFINDDESLLISSIVVEKKGEKLTYSDANTSIPPDDLKKYLNVNLPVYLSIDGKGVIHKIIDKKSVGSPIDQIFPDAKADDFLIQETLLSQDRRIISAVRQEKVRELMVMINSSGFDVLKILLGPFSVMNIAAAFPGEATFQLPFYNIFFVSGTISGFEKSNKAESDFFVNIDSQVVNSEVLVPYSLCLLHFKGDENFTCDSGFMQPQKENFRYRRLFQLTGWGCLIIFFLTLLANFFLFENFRGRNQVYSAQIASNKEILVKIGVLNNQLKVKQDFYSRGLSNNNQIYALYSDKIAKGVPPDITLSKLCISPAVVSPADKEAIVFQKGRILISGYTLSSDDLDSWIQSVRTEPWINEIAIKSFSDNNRDAAKFDLEISIKEEKQ